MYLLSDDVATSEPHLPMLCRLLHNNIASIAHAAESSDRGEARGLLQSTKVQQWAQHTYYRAPFQTDSIKFRRNGLRGPSCFRIDFATRNASLTYFQTCMRNVDSAS